MPVELVEQNQPLHLQSAEVFPFLVAAMVFAIAFAAIDKLFVQARYGFRNHKAHIVNFLVCLGLAAISFKVLR